MNNKGCNNCHWQTVDVHDEPCLSCDGNPRTPSNWREIEPDEIKPIKLEVGKWYSHKSCGTKYMIVGFPKMRKDNGEWVEGVLYENYFCNSFVREKDDFLNKMNKMNEVEAL